MNIFDIFRKRKEIPTPWQKFYTEEELNFKLPNSKKSSGKDSDNFSATNDRSFLSSWSISSG